MYKKAVVGRKVGMTQVWNDNNDVVPVTVLEITPCRVVEVKTKDKHGYEAVQVAFGSKDISKVNKPSAGVYEKAGVEPGQGLTELRLEDVSEYSVGQEISCEIFQNGDVVDVTAKSKGKGFAGVMKRHNFAGQRATHGAHLVHRMPGSIGMCATPSRVFKGQRMAGRMGGENVTTQNLEVVKSDPEKNVLLVKGSVPGAKGASVIIKSSIKQKVQS